MHGVNKEHGTKKKKSKLNSS